MFTVFIVSVMEVLITFHLQTKVNRNIINGASRNIKEKTLASNSEQNKQLLMNPFDLILVITSTNNN